MPNLSQFVRRAVKSVQRGIIATGNDAVTDVTISAVNVAKSELITTLTSSQQASVFFSYGVLQDSTTVRFIRDDAVLTGMVWQVVEYY